MMINFKYNIIFSETEWEPVFTLEDYPIMPEKEMLKDFSKDMDGYGMLCWKMDMALL